MDSYDVQAVLSANEAFYTAFRARDAQAMDAVWAEHSPIACMHPGMDVISGRDEVMRSWRGILAHADAPRIECARPRVHLLGDAAFVTCLEGMAGDSPALVATNVFVRESGGWKMVLHQAAPLSVRRQPKLPRKPADPGTMN